MRQALNKRINHTEQKSVPSTYVLELVDAWQALGNFVKHIHPAQISEADIPVEKW